MSFNRIGQALYAIAAAGLAVLMLAYHDFAPMWHTVPEGMAGREAGVVAAGLLILAAAVGLCFRRTALPGVMVIGGYAAIWTVMGLPPILRKPLSLGSWYGLFEALTPVLGAWTLRGVLRDSSQASRRSPVERERELVVVRVLFGLNCAVYGAAHFAYADLTASMVPAWLPDRLDLAYLTGLAHLAAGVGLIVGVVPRLAATLEAVMMSSFGALVWVPTLLAQSRPTWAPTLRYQWSEFVVTLLLAASAWLIAGSQSGAPRGFAARSIA